MTTNHTFTQSFEIADDILAESSNLAKTDVTAHMYEERIPYLTDIVGSEGKISFHPLVSKDFVEDFRQALQPELEQKRTDYCYSPTGNARKERDEFYLAQLISESINNNDLISNKVSQEMSRYIKDNSMEGYNSPKLSKILVKLFGERSDVVKWFTNSCPKRLDKGLNTEYTIHLSVLPHHLMGMSYYAPANFEGERWITGWNGTSCMDTIRNGDGQCIYQLPPNLLDTTLAIAYLTKSGEDEGSPRYLARTLVRVAKVNENDYVMLGARVFYTSNETKYLLVEGLKSKFSNFVDAEELRNKYTPSETKSFLSPLNVTWEVQNAKVECSDCDGEGGYNDESCENCDGCGYHYESDSYTPYIDDPQFVQVTYEGISIKLPTDWLEERGYIEKEVEPITDSNFPFAC